MQWNHWVFLLLFYSAGGSFIALGVLRQERAPARFFFYLGLLSSGAAAIAYFVLGGHPVRPYFQNALFPFMGLALLYALTAGRRWFLSTFFYVFGAIACGFVVGADVVAGFVGKEKDWLRIGLTLAQAFSSVFLLGFTLIRFGAGQQWFKFPKFPIGELRNLSAFWVFTLVLRLAASTWAGTHYYFATGASVEAFWRHSPEMYLALRWFGGILAPLFFACFVWARTQKTRKHQEGVLFYFTVLCILLGEALALRLHVYSGIPC